MILKKDLVMLGELKEIFIKVFLLIMKQRKRFIRGGLYEYICVIMNLNIILKLLNHLSGSGFISFPIPRSGDNYGSK